MRKKRFSKVKYRKNMLNKETYLEWVKVSGINISFTQWEECWEAIRKALYREMIENPAGVDLPLFMGNLSVKILDKEFKCAEDFIKTAYRPGKGAERKLVPFISTDVRVPKITWTKHKLFMGIPALFGLQPSSTMRREISAGIRGKLNYYQKVRNYSRKKSKCTDKPQKGMFDD